MGCVSSCPYSPFQTLGGIITANHIPITNTGTLTRSTLAGKVTVVTGAGQSIGLETARALCWLGVLAKLTGG